MPTPVGVVGGRSVGRRRQIAESGLRGSPHPLVNRGLGENPVHHDRSGRPHPMDSGDGLYLCAWLALRLGDDYNQGGVDIDADPPASIWMTTTAVPLNGEIRYQLLT